MALLRLLQGYAKAKRISEVMAIGNTVSITFTDIEPMVIPCETCAGAEVLSDALSINLNLA